MKHTIYTLFALLCCLTFTSCDNDEWGNDNEAMAHIYYIGFENWAPKLNNTVTYDVPQGETLAIPMQFYCEFVRSYDVETYYYVTGSLTRGTDYEVADEQGNVLQPNADGAFTLHWPNAIKGVKNIYIKALNGSKGKFTVQTFNPAADYSLDPNELESTIQHTEKEYEVRIFTQNYKVTVNIQ